MIGALRTYVAVVDRFNYGLGRVIMFGIFALMGVLLFSSINKTFFTPTLWTLEMAQFLMVGYFILGGPYAMQMGANVRMDLFYGEFSPRRKAWTDCFTVLFLLVYLAILLWGGIESTIYSFQYGGERSPSAWRPYLWPIKVTMCIGIGLMLLQALSELAKDILFLRTGEPVRHQDQEPSDAL
ncbi:TRAP transporter DctQ family protein [Roseivivax marinus]|uniref:TRAP transporter small permease protein n=1 Tax=Roseivivax marinus TaxID=1379903 RepID=W4HGW9_9RHOB|nr:TRAP transporter small permease subunit [Roseivivax marinus]ETW11653.1 TRAP transporter DctQ family protein [Roseivivax marinus]SEL44172.1 TRAP-type mannitol/chloroaromatic compound transport system, small permease component [Roseivivax marinus]